VGGIEVRGIMVRDRDNISRGGIEKRDGGEGWR
jgi:hypothetical protein